MVNIKRDISKRLGSVIGAGKSILLLGPRQVGKTTLLKRQKADISLNMALPRTRLKYAKDPESLLSEVVALATRNSKPPVVFIDEIQKVPDLLDVIQVGIDEKQAQFLLSGSSARKLKRQAEVNLLPGRLVSFRLDSLSVQEVKTNGNPSLDELLSNGSLPGIYLESAKDVAVDILRSYVEIYLEEEIRKETEIKNLGAFGRFLEMAALEAGQIVNFSSVGTELGISPHTVRSYYEVLEETLIIERIDPIYESTSRKRLVRSSRYLFFDLGVRRIAAREPRKFISRRKGQVFEQFIGMELIKLMRSKNTDGRLHFWRDSDSGVEVDWVIDISGTYIPIEVKLTERPILKDTKHLMTFKKEYKNCNDAFLICCVERPMTLSNGVQCLAWQDLPLIIEKLTPLTR